MQLTPIKKTFTYGAHQVTLETGEMARQGARRGRVSMDDSVVLCTVRRGEAGEGKPGLPAAYLRLHREDLRRRQDSGRFFQARRQAFGEGDADLPADRPAHPPAVSGRVLQRWYMVLPQVLSCNPEVDPDIPALIGVSAVADSLGIPFKGPIAAARVGYVNGQYVLQPDSDATQGKPAQSRVAGTEHAVLMWNRRRTELPEEFMLGSVVFGHEQMKAAIQGDPRLGRPGREAAWEWKPVERTAARKPAIKELSESELRAAFTLRQKQARSEAIDAIWKRVFDEVGVGKEGGPDANAVKEICFELESKIVRNHDSGRRSPGSTVATPAPFGRSASAWACSPARTARRCLPVARRRHWWCDARHRAR